MPFAQPSPREEKTRSRVPHLINSFAHRRRSQ
jgi:hypothetical protein